MTFPLENCFGSSHYQTFSMNLTDLCNSSSTEDPIKPCCFSFYLLQSQNKCCFLNFSYAKSISGNILNIFPTLIVETQCAGTRLSLAPQVSVTNVQVNFTNFARHNCVRINFFSSLFATRVFFFFPADGEGNE